MTSLFISCVSNEFGNYRDAIRRDLSRPNLHTKIQEDFIAYGGATLEKLDDYIKSCEAVIHICGDMTGAMANEISIQYINNKYTDFGKRFPELQPVLDGIAHLSYTQWEAWLAIYHGKRLFIAAPTATAIRDSRCINDPTQTAHQLEHLKRLKEKGYYDEIHFNTKDELIIELYKSKLGDILNQIPKVKPINLPYQSIGASFKGREDELKDISEIFSRTTNGTAAIALHGLGGMGKTRLAVEYALKHKNDYTALLFVHAGVPELLKTNMAHLSDPLIMNLPEYETADEERKYAGVVNWLNTYSNWLLILDNADTPQASEKVEELFATLQNGHLLITTRMDNWSQQIKKKPLGVLKPAPAIAFLLETTEAGREKRADDPEMAGKIAEDLGYLALALEQARAYIITKEISLAGYYKKWEANRIDVLKWFNKQQMQYPASVAITWQTSFGQLSAAAINLLNRLSWMASDPIPKNLLEMEVPNAESLDAIGAWEELKQYSLATSSEDKKTFTIHRLVQDVTRDNLDKTQTVQILNEALSWMDKAFTGDPQNVDDWPVLEPLAPHVLSLLEHAECHETVIDFTGLMNVIGVLFLTKAQYTTAEPLMRRALEIDEQSFGANHPNVAVKLNNLAQLLQHINRLAEAEPFMRRALEIDEQSFGANHPNVAVKLNNLAQLLQHTNRLAEAEPFMRRALQIDEHSFGSSHPNVARDLSPLAGLLKSTNRLLEAEPLMRRALEIDEQSFGANHPNVAVKLNNLAQLLHTTNRLAEAEPLMRRALEIDEQSFGANHPRVASDLSNLAGLLKSTNRLQEAELLMRRALEIDEQSFGANHPTVAIRLNNLAQLLQITDRLQEAERLFKKALEIDEKSFGANHPNIAVKLNNLAQLLQDTNRLAEAEPLMIRALQIVEQSFGLNHTSVATCLNNLARLLIETNRFQEAEPLMKRALEIDEKSLGSNHPKVAIDLNNLAQLFQATNRLTEAESLMKRTLQINEQSLGANHPNVARDLNNLAQLFQATNRLQEAEPLFRRALKIVEQSLGSKHTSIATILGNLAALLQDTNRLQEAEPFFRRALEIDEQGFGANHPNVARDLNNLARLLQDTNRLQEAERLFRRALEINEQSLGLNHTSVAIDLNNLALLFQATNRHQEAEPLFRRALEIDEQSLGLNHTSVAIDLNNLARLFQATYRLAEAEPLMRRAFIIFRQSLAVEHPNTEAVGGNYILLLQEMGKSEEEINAIFLDLL